VNAGPIDLVVVGSRPGPLHAASRLGHRVLLVEERQPARAALRRVDAWVSVPFSAPPADVVAAVAERLDGRAPRAVLAAGERGVFAAAALRDAHGLRGVSSETATLARDKARMKEVARAGGVPCADWRIVDGEATAEGLVDRLGLPLVLKHRTGSGSRELVVARTLEEASEGLAHYQAHAPEDCMAEAFVEGVEMSVESFLHDGEILLANPTEYLVPAFANVAPARLGDAEREDILALNAVALGALGLRHGMTHLELFRTQAGPVFGEVAVRAPGGRIMRLLRRAYDFDPWDAVVQLECGERPNLPAAARRSAGVWMLHPGAGTVQSVRGLAAARRVKGVRKLVCRVRKGSRVAARETTGSDVGWIEVGAPSSDIAAKRLRQAHDLVTIEMA
jgi:biotin carboxylase